MKAITIHGRTRMQFYNGKADWDAIRSVREVTSVPLIANGDVDSVADAHEILRRSGADAVMVGRSCQGRPWHAGVLAGTAAHPDAAGVARIFAEHYETLLEFYGVEVGLRTARKHAGWYLDRFATELPVSQKAAILTSTDTVFVRDGVAAAIARSGDVAAREEIAA